MGNCFRACIASLLEIPIDEVPNFNAEPVKDWHMRYAAWLNKRGLGVCHLGTPAFLTVAGVKDAYFIVSGKSPRGIDHAVIYKGPKMVHDPHPSGGGVEPDTVDILFPLDPAEYFMPTRHVEEEMEEEDMKEGDTCRNTSCTGRMGFEKVDDCRCHINPPCSRCVDNPLVCLLCGQRADE